MSGTSDKLSGKAKQVIGKATDNKKLQGQGKVQETKGSLKDHLKATGDAVSKKVDKAAKKVAK